MKITINENDLRKMVNECVKKILNEGIASKWLQRMAKQHGGISSVDKRLQLDKLDLNFYREFVPSEKFGDIPDVMYRFIDTSPVVTFKDGLRLFMIKPEYMKDEKIKNAVASIWKSSDELSAERNTDYSPGEREDWEEYGDSIDGTYWRKEKYHTTPEQERMKKHKYSRGKKKEIAKGGNDKDYDKYVLNYLMKKYNGEYIYTGGGVSISVPYSGHKWDDGAYEIRDDFEKYGYGLNDYWSKDYKYLVFTKGKETIGSDYGRMPGTSKIDYRYDSEKIDAPKIGTKGFGKKS